MRRDGERGKQNHIDSEFVQLTPTQVGEIKDDPNETNDRRRRAVRHLKALGLRHAAKRKT